MPRLVQAVPKYRKHKQSGQAIVTVNGRDYLLGPHGTKASHLQYDRLIAEWLASGRSTSYGAHPHEQVGLTVVELVRDYLKYVAEFHGTGPKSQYQRTVIALRPLRELYGKTPAEEFGVLQFRAVRQRAATAGRSRRYVNE